MDINDITLDATRLILSLPGALTQVETGQRCSEALDLLITLNLKLSTIIDPRDSKQCFLTLLRNMVSDDLDDGDDHGTGICPVQKSWYTATLAWQQRVQSLIEQDQEIVSAAKISLGCQTEIDPADFLDRIMPGRAMLLSSGSARCCRLFGSIEYKETQGEVPNRLAELNEWIADYRNSDLEKRRERGLSDWLPGSPFLSRPIFECLSELSVDQMSDASIPLPQSAIRLLLAEIDLMAHRQHIDFTGMSQQDSPPSCTFISAKELVTIVPEVLPLVASEHEVRSTISPLLSAVSSRFSDDPSVLNGRPVAVEPFAIVGLLSVPSVEMGGTDGDIDMPDQARVDQVYATYAVYPSLASIRVYVCPLPGRMLESYYDMMSSAVEKIHLVVTAGLDQSVILSGIQCKDWTTTIHSMGTLLPSRTAYLAAHTGPLSVYFAWLITSSPSFPLGRGYGPTLPRSATAEETIARIKMRLLDWLLRERYAAKKIWKALRSGEGWKLRF